MTRTVFVTGGIGSGKSAFCKALSAYGIPVYDSDSRTKQLYDENEDLVPALESALGCGSLRDSDGFLDRAKLSSVIFSDPQKLQALEAIVHPAVLYDFLKWKESIQIMDPTVPFVVMESAVVLQKPLFDGIADLVVLVDAPEEVRLERACRRDSKSREAVLGRIRNQKIDSSKADIIILNDSDLETLQASALDLLRQLSEPDSASQGF